MIGLLALVHGLPADGFYTGDSGVKLVATRDALEHPRHPLDILPPVVGGRSRPEFLGVFFPAHGDHAHARTPPLLPLLTAPLLAGFGLRGLLVLPLAGFLLTVWAAGRLAQAVAPGLPPAWARLALASSPVFFYGLEFWEHAPACALLALATVALLAPSDAGSGAREAVPATRTWVAAGVLVGLAFWLRPEALGYGSTLLVAALLLLVPRAARGARVCATAAGLIGGAGPLLVFDLSHFGSLSNPHLAANLGVTLGTVERLRLATLWLAPGGDTSTALAISALVLGGVAWAQAWPQRAGVGRLAVVAGAALISLLAVQGVLPRENLWRTFPLAALAFVPARRPWTRKAGVLAAALAGHVVASVSGVPNDGGAQWGPRYLLPICLPLALFAARAAQALATERRPNTRRAALATLVALVAAGAWVQRDAYRDLRTTKRLHARIVAALRERTVPGDVIVSDLWWLDEIAAALDDRTFLYVDSANQARAALRAVAEGPGTALIVRSLAESRPKPLADQLGGECTAGRTSAVEPRTLRLTPVACARGVP